MIKQLPERPNFDQLKKQAKDLLDAIHLGQADAYARAALTNSEGAVRDAFALHDAQRVIAREYGFPSWAKLKLHVETRAEDAAEARLVHAILEGEEEVVCTILQERPALARRSVFTAAALGEEIALGEALTQDAGVAAKKGGPRGWELLLYVCFGRSGGGDAERARIARALIAAGANPNAAWIHPDWPESPLPALYGATGVNDRPQLARVLLEAGADPNDGESRYHAAEHHHVASLEVLREFGTDFSGRDRNWGTTPLCFLLGWTQPTKPVRDGVVWLLENGADPNVRAQRATLDQTALHAAVATGWDVEIIELMLKRGADPTVQRSDGRDALALAVRSGREEVVAALVRHGVPNEPAPRDAFLGCCMRGDVAGARRWLETTPDLMSTLSRWDRDLALLLAKHGRAEALRAIGELGFDLAVEGGDGEHPLHWAAWNGHAAAVRALVAAKVPLTACDRRFGAPPTGWCAHGSQACPGGGGGRHAEAMELLIAAGAHVAPGTSGSPEIMAVLKRAGVGR